MGKVILFSLMLICGSLAHAGFFSGNGGEGTEVNGGLCVLDLYLAGLTQSPYVGSEIDPLLPPLPSAQEFRLDYPHELLARKLTDINSVAPGLGDFLIDVIRAYNWIPVPSNIIVPTPHDADDEIPGLTDSQRLPLANRFEMNIRVDSERWARLDDMNKVALILHEALYSLLRPVSDGAGYWRQPAYMAREITADFFLSTFFAKPTGVNYARLALELSLPTPLPTLEEARRQPQWSLAFYDQSVILNLSSQNAVSLEAAAASFCKKIAPMVSEAYNYSISSVILPRAFALDFLKYEVASGETLRTQQYIGIRRQSSTINRIFLGDPAYCMPFFEDLCR